MARRKRDTDADNQRDTDADSPDGPPREILMPMDPLEDAGEGGHTGRQRSARNDPAMRDGNGSHGTPDWDAEDELNTDNDVGDEIETDPPYGGPSGGAVGGTPAQKRAKGGHKRHGIDPGHGGRGDSTVGADDE